MNNPGCTERAPRVRCPALLLLNSVSFLLSQASTMSRSFCMLSGSFSALMSSYSLQNSLVQPQKMALHFPCCLGQPSRVVIAFSRFLNLITASSALLKPPPLT